MTKKNSDNGEVLPNSSLNKFISGCVLVAIPFLVSYLLVTFRESGSLKRPSSCDNALILHSVQDYFEGEEIGQVLSRALNALDSQRDPKMYQRLFVDKLIKGLSSMDNICDSEEARFLQYYCHNWPNGSLLYSAMLFAWRQFLEFYFDNGQEYPAPTLVSWITMETALTRVPLSSGENAMHYCTKVTGIPPPKPITSEFFVKMEKLLSNFIKPTAEKTDNILDHVFGLGVKETDKKSRTDAQETNVMKLQGNIKMKDRNPSNYLVYYYPEVPRPVQ